MTLSFCDLFFDIKMYGLESEETEECVIKMARNIDAGNSTNAFIIGAYL